MRYVFLKNMRHLPNLQKAEYSEAAHNFAPVALCSRTCVARYWTTTIEVHHVGTSLKMSSAAAKMEINPASPEAPEQLFVYPSTKRLP
jgi:hypothetical protein